MQGGQFQRPVEYLTGQSSNARQPPPPGSPGRQAEHWETIYERGLKKTFWKMWCRLVTAVAIMLHSPNRKQE